MTDLAERLLQPLGFAAIAAIGLWLVLRVRQIAPGRGCPWRGQPRSTRRRGHDPHGHHDHDHHHHYHDHGHGNCGHAHAPGPSRSRPPPPQRELLALIGAVAIRPCTGAIFLLILTAQMGVFIWGIVGNDRHGAGHGVGDGRAVALAAVFLLRQARWRACRTGASAWHACSRRWRSPWA
jgi:nickel/cobalt exporter